MNIVIAGAGAVGTHLAKMLSRQEHNIMLIDTNQDKLEDNMWGYHRTVDQKVNIGSAFLQNEWKK